MESAPGQVVTEVEDLLAISGSGDTEDRDMASSPSSGSSLVEVTSDDLAAREGRLVAVSREIIQLPEESGDMAVRLQGAMEQLMAKN